MSPSKTQEKWNVRISKDKFRSFKKKNNNKPLNWIRKFKILIMKRKKNKNSYKVKSKPLLDKRIKNVMTLKDKLRIFKNTLLSKDSNFKRVKPILKRRRMSAKTFTNMLESFMRQLLNRKNKSLPVKICNKRKIRSAKNLRNKSKSSLSKWKITRHKFHKQKLNKKSKVAKLRLLNNNCHNMNILIRGLLSKIRISPISTWTSLKASKILEKWVWNFLIANKNSEDKTKKICTQTRILKTVTKTFVFLSMISLKERRLFLTITENSQRTMRISLIATKSLETLIRS